GLARGEAEQAAVALRAGGVAVVAGAEPDDRAPGLRLAAGDLLHERGQRLGVASADRGGGAGDQAGDVVSCGLHFPAFAAAFMAFLCSRTLASDSGETMSATLRKDPSSP